MYAEAQRRDGDNKELGAALAALMFNVLQLMRTVMGIVQLNAFVAWCKDAVACMRALLGRDAEHSQQSVDSRAVTNDDDVGSREDSRERGNSIARIRIYGSSRFKIIIAWFKRVVRRMNALLHGHSENDTRNSSREEETTEISAGTDMSWVYDHGIQEKIKVNNTVIDNELGGREVTVSPSWKKMWGGMKKYSFTPSSWLQTDRVMLSTVRWSGAFLCGMGGHWGVNEYSHRGQAEILETFFSREMELLRDPLQLVEWNIESENGSCEILSIDGLNKQDGYVELAGEMSMAYGTSFVPYLVEHTWNVDLYSFDFNNLVSSYRANENQILREYRESVQVGLAHSIVVAKHLGFEKLKQIRRYYDQHHVLVGRIRKDAFKLLSEQANCLILDDDLIWKMFESIELLIPLFPYRMQAVALWEEATNRRVLQASAHQDLRRSLQIPESSKMEKERILNNVSRGVDIFDFCAEWAMEHIEEKGLLGVVLETARTFLGEWIVAGNRDPVWEPELPTNCFDLGIGETNVFSKTEIRQDRLIWVCQRELQRDVAQTFSKNENLPGNAALIMLFLLGFPFLRMEEVQDAENGTEENPNEAHDEGVSSSSNNGHSLDVSVQLWRVWTALAPQDISLMLRVDLTNCTVSLRLQNSCGDGRFIWQHWVDAAMGYMKGAEERGDGEFGYGRQIVRSDLRMPMLELCPLRFVEDRLYPRSLDENGVDVVVKKTSTARVWLGWPLFDVKTCKFEMDQWLAACEVNVNIGLEDEERQEAENEVAQAEYLIRRIVHAENEDAQGSAQDGTA